METRDDPVSVVTVNLNSGHAVERTIRSVLAQDYPFQWVVVDGGSTDGSGDRLRAAVRPGDSFVSEPDQGISDAFNKGLARATGEAVLFMNAGDEFAHEHSLRDLVAAWDRGRWRWIIGYGEIVREDGVVLFRRGFSSLPSDPISMVRYNCQIMHQSVMAERSLFTELGEFDASFRIAADHELWIRWLSRGIHPQVTRVLVCRFHRGGTSSNPLHNLAEVRRALERHGIVHPRYIVLALTMLAKAKILIRGRYGLWLYALKERLGIRI